MSLGTAAQAIESLYGDDLRTDAGLLHVAAGWCDPAGSLFGLRITPDSPRSAADEFVLALGRARSDAIVTTGAILRAEKNLDHRMVGPPHDGLARWRREVLGRRERPLSVVLTRGRDLDFSHPFFRGGQRVLIFTGLAAAAALASSARAVGAEVIAHEAPGLLTLLDHLEGPLGLGNLTIEAGPRTTAALYRSPLRVREWLLSIYRGEDLAEELRAGSLPSRSEVEALGLELASERAREEVSGHWIFQRYVRP